MRKSMGLFVATAALAGSLFTATPAHAWTCATDEILPPQVGRPGCVLIVTVAQTVCRALPSACW